MFPTFSSRLKETEILRGFEWLNDVAKKAPADASVYLERLVDKIIPGAGFICDYSEIAEISKRYGFESLLGIAEQKAKEIDCPTF